MFRLTPKACNKQKPATSKLGNTIIEMSSSVVRYDYKSLHLMFEVKCPNEL